MSMDARRHRRATPGRDPGRGWRGRWVWLQLDPKRKNAIGEFLMLWASVFLWWLFIVLSGMIAKSKNRSVFGWGLLAFLTGPIGLILVAAMPHKTERM